ncbi:MAG: response regulator [Ferruginibacter sp.]
MTYQKTFLIVDDDPDDRYFFCEILKGINASLICLTAFDGEDALLQCAIMKPLPDFIFLDLNMPRMDGRECLVELKKDPRLKNIPVIIFSTSSTQKDIDETRKLGAAYFITKPTDFKEIQNEIIFVMQNDWSVSTKDAAL